MVRHTSNLRPPTYCRTVLRMGSLIVVLVLHISSTAEGAGPRVMAEGTLPPDARLAPLRHLRSYFPFTASEDASDWPERAERLRRQILVSQGLWPLPTRTPLNPVIHSRRDMSDYTIEKIYFESMPGFFVTGNLYRPVGHEGPRPAVLSPHGHGRDGRFYDLGLQGVREKIIRGEERFEDGGRDHRQSRCVQLARMGCVVFLYDMIGYADSQQINYELAHRFAVQRPDMNNAESWGLFSPQAESRLQGVMGLQTWNSIRSLDFLIDLPEVDPDRIAVTGSSGGGTQTMIVSAVDDRVAVSVPVVMVSTAMQGGCTCENACCLRVGAGNIDFAALCAPRPQLIIAADDWTREMPTKGFPELRQHYALLDAENHVELAAYLQFKHNYNYVSRSAMYQFMNRHLQLGLDEPVVEEAYERLVKEDLTVWDENHPAPAGGPRFERELLQWWNDDCRRQIDQLRPHDAESLAEFCRIVGGGFETIVSRSLPRSESLEWELEVKNEREGYIEMAGLIVHRRNASTSETLPAVFLYPEQWNEKVVLWLSPEGKAGLYQSNGDLQPHVVALIEAGHTVVGVDLLYQGEFLADGVPPTITRRVENPRESAAYTLGYNSPLVAHRAHDVLTVAAFIRSHELAPRRLILVADGEETAPIAALAAFQSGDAIDAIAIDTGGFRFAALESIRDIHFIPGAVRYGDLPGLLALAAPRSLWLAGEGESVPPPIEAVYTAEEAAEKFTFFAGDTAAESDIVDWILADGK